MTGMGADMKDTDTVAFVVLIVGVCCLIAYNSGYATGYKQGRLDEIKAWDESYDGYCFADNPPHKGQCKETK